MARIKFDAAGNRIYSKSQRNRIKAAARKVAEAMERVAEAATATESYRDEWKAPGMRAPRIEPASGPDTRKVISRQHSCGLKCAGEWNPTLYRIEGDDTPPPPPPAPQPQPSSFEGERVLVFRRKRVPPPPGSASSVDSPFHRQGIWEPFDERNTQHREPPAATQLFNER
jgi:hypothetical protein